MSSPADLSAALEAELAAAARLSHARTHVDVLLDDAIASGTPYDEIARVALRIRLGRAPTLVERIREVQRLRQRRRRAVTGRHANRSSAVLDSPTSLVPSSSEVTPMARTLIKKTTTVEEFLDDDGKTKPCDDDKDEAIEDEEDEDEDETE